MSEALLRWGLILLIILFVSIQAVPYGRNQANPPVQQEPRWDSERTRELAVRACYNCHSNEVVWPWYGVVAPASWLIQNDVDEGRGELNFSEWNRPQKEAREAAKSVREGSMPPWYYSILHPTASLSSEERQALIRSLQAIMGQQGERSSAVFSER